MFKTEKNSSKNKKKRSEEGQTMATAAEKPLMVVGEKANRGETIDGESLHLPVLYELKRR